MDSSRRAVEAYWRSRMVDGVTADEDKVAPVYKLEEICELLRTSHVSIVKEVSEYILKRLDHKSPIVKQKALRLVKYSVGKSGGEFRREMQRHSAVMRQLVHYKGQVDPLKGDALNKAVRDTAQEAISAIFADEDSGKPVASLENVNKRIEGFGNTNYEMPSEDKKSFLSEVVGIGSASIKQGLSSIAAVHSMRKNDNGSYKSPTLRKSLTTEVDSGGRYEGGDHLRESWSAAGIPKSGASGTWSSDARTSVSSTAVNEDTNSSQTGVKTREERLLDTIATSGGVRLQPTRDAVQVFLAEASKLDALAMSYALEAKLQSHLWQVRMKAICVLESILRKKDDEHFSIIASYFSENKDSVVKCSDLPQVSLREKANKVLGLLDRDQTPGAVYAGESSNAKSMPVPSVQMPDLIDTGEADDYGSETSANKQVDQDIGDLISPSPLVDDLFGSGPLDSLSASTTANRNEEDPFADVSFHVSQDKQNDDIFSGLAVDDRSDYLSKAPTSTTESALFDVFGSEQIIPEKSIDKNNVHELISGLSLNGLAQENMQPGASGLAFSGSTFFDGNSQPNPLLTNGILNGILGSNVVASSTPIQYNMPQNVMLNAAFAAQPMNYGSVGAFIAQQQLLFQNFGNLSAGYGQAAGTAMPGAYSSAALPDIFQLSNNQVQSPVATLTSSKKDDTKAFDFISDHLSAARDSKRVL